MQTCRLLLFVLACSQAYNAEGDQRLVFEMLDARRHHWSGHPRADLDSTVSAKPAFANKIANQSILSQLRRCPGGVLSKWLSKLPPIGPGEVPGSWGQYGPFNIWQCPPRAPTIVKITLTPTSAPSEPVTHQGSEADVLRDWAFVFDIFGPLLTGCYMMTPLLPAWRIIKRRDVGKLSPFPYIVGVFNGVLWIYYGTVTWAATGKDYRPNIFINIFGCVIWGVLLLPFLAFSRSPSRVWGQVAFLIIFSVANIAFYHYIVASLDWQFHFGDDDMPLAASFCGVEIVCLNTFLYVFPLVQLRSIVRTRSVGGMPLGMCVLALVICSIWAFQGSVYRDPTLLIPNCFGLLVGGAQMILYGMFRGNTKNSLLQKEESLSERLT